MSNIMLQMKISIYIIIIEINKKFLPDFHNLLNLKASKFKLRTERQK